MRKNFQMRFLFKMKNYQNIKTKEIVEAKIVEDTNNKFIAIKKVSKFGNYILITGSKFYQLIK